MTYRFHSKEHIKGTIMGIEEKIVSVQEELNNFDQDRNEINPDRYYGEIEDLKSLKEHLLEICDEIPDDCELIHEHNAEEYAIEQVMLDYGIASDMPEHFLSISECIDYVFGDCQTIDIDQEFYYIKERS